MATGSAARWVCTVCGYVHEGAAPPEECPVCGAGPDLFEAYGLAPAAGPEPEADASPGDYLSAWARPSDDFERKFSQIRDLAVTGVSASSAMRTQRSFPGWDEILFRGGQLFRMPLNGDEPVNSRTVIGPRAAKPLELSMPVYVSHMSFGALSKEAKMALARGAWLAGTAIGSGEGGLLPEERREAGRYIYELGTAAFSHVDDAIRQADAVEIKIGQAAKPGMGGHLPADKVSEEVARIRGLAPGEASISPARYSGVNSPADLKREVARIRTVAEGKPVGIKIAAGHVEQDLELALQAEPDFITLDTRGGGTGSAPIFVKDNVCIPAVFALYRARRFLDQAGSDVSLCITGGFRDGADIAKALAMGADAVALATASLIAIGCQQYRVCHTGRCPVGITTQDPELRKRLDVEQSAQRLFNFLGGTGIEIEAFARINGRSDVHALDTSDLVTLNGEISANTNIAHA